MELWSPYERTSMISSLNEDRINDLMFKLRTEYNLYKISGNEGKAEILEKTIENLRRVESGSLPYHYQTGSSLLIGILCELEELNDPFLNMAVIESFGKKSLSREDYISKTCLAYLRILNSYRRNA